MFASTYSERRRGRPVKGLLRAACMGLVSVALLTSLAHAQAKATDGPAKSSGQLKDSAKPSSPTWVSDLIASDPSKVGILGKGSNSGDKADTASKAAPSGSRVNAGVHGRVYAMDSGGTLLGTVTGATIELKGQSGAGASKITSGENGYYKADLQPGSTSTKSPLPATRMKTRVVVSMSRSLTKATSTISGSSRAMTTPTVSHR